MEAPLCPNCGHIVEVIVQAETTVKLTEQGQQQTRESGQAVFQCWFCEASGPVEVSDE